MAPDEAAAEELLFTSDPLMLKCSVVPKPFKSTVAPDAMVVEIFDPKAALLPSFKIPALMVVGPEYVFIPESDQVPKPDLVSVPELLITPETVALPDPPKMADVVSVMAPDAIADVALLFSSDPEIMNISGVVCPFKSTMAPDMMVVEMFVPNAALLPNFKVPPDTVVAPVYVFVAVKNQVPASFFSIVPAPLIMPEAIASPVPPIIAALVRVIFPESVADVPLLFTNEPLTVKSSAVIKPFKSTKAFNAMVVAVVVPNAALFPSFKVPTLTVVAAL